MDSGLHELGPAYCRPSKVSSPNKNLYTKPWSSGKMLAEARAALAHARCRATHPTSRFEKRSGFYSSVVDTCFAQHHVLRFKIRRHTHQKSSHLPNIDRIVTASTSDLPRLGDCSEFSSAFHPVRISNDIDHRQRFKIRVFHIPSYSLVEPESRKIASRS